LAAGTFLCALFFCTPAAQAGSESGYYHGSESQQQSQPSQQMEQQSSFDQQMGSERQITSVSSDLMEQTLRNTDGQALGKISDIMIDKQTGRVAYVIVEDHVVPFSALQPDQQGNLLLVSIDQQQFLQSPQKRQDMASRELAAQVQQFYGVAPFQQEGAQQGQTQQTQQQQQMASFSTDLLNKTLKNAQNKELGQIQDVIIDKQAGVVAYVIVENHVVPFNALQPDQQGNLLLVNIDEQQFQQSPLKQQNMGSRDFARQVHQYYGVAPYWEEQEGQQLLEKMKQDQPMQQPMSPSPGAGGSSGQSQPY